MNKLEQKFAESFENRGGSAKEMREINARIAAKIALELAERAYNKGIYDARDSRPGHWYGETFEGFKKEIL